MLGANTNGHFVLVIESSLEEVDTSPGNQGANLKDLKWNVNNPLLAQPLILTEFQMKHTFGVQVNVSLLGVMAAMVLRYAVWSATTSGVPASSNFGIRVRLVQWDTEDPATVPYPTGTIYTLIQNATIAIQ